MAVLGISYVAVWSKDLTQNRNLFANTLELPISYEDEDIVVFETDGAQLVLQRAKGPDEHLDGTVQFGFNVNRLEAITTALKAGGHQVELDQEDLGMQKRVTAVRLASGQSVEFIGD